MLRYMLAIVAALIAATVAVFAVVALTNGDDASGPAPELTVRVSETSVQPASVEVDEDRLVHLKLVNGASTLRVMTADKSVQQLPPQLDDYDPRGTNDPLPYLRITAPSGGETSAFVKFTERGTYQVRIETPGREGTLQMLTVVVV